MSMLPTPSPTGPNVQRPITPNQRRSSDSDDSDASDILAVNGRKRKADQGLEDGDEADIKTMRRCLTNMKRRGGKRNEVRTQELREKQEAEAIIEHLEEEIKQMNEVKKQHHFSVKRFDELNIRYEADHRGFQQEKARLEERNRFLEGENQVLTGQQRVQEKQMREMTTKVSEISIESIGEENRLTYHRSQMSTKS